MNSTRCVSLFFRALASVSFAVLCYVATSSSSSAQTVIYDGSQDLNFFSASHLTDDLMLTNNPTDVTRNGIVSAGADPNVLEPGDSAWFRSAGRRMRNTNLGSASTAVGADGDFMSSLFDATGATTSGGDANGVGAGFVLYDTRVTTGMQTLNISLYYNDPTPNAADPANDILSGGNVAIRVTGIRDTGNASDPWGDDDFTFLAGSGFAGHFFSSGNHRVNSDEAVNPVVDRLFLAESAFDADFAADEILSPSADWQQLSFQFDAGAGYDYLIISVGGVIQDANTLGVDRFGFDNISFEPAATSVLGDFDGDGDVDCDDLDGYIGNIGASATGALAALDFDSDGTISQADANSVITTLVVAGGVAGTFVGDFNCDGSVDVLGDAFTLVGSLGQNVTSYSEGDATLDGTVDVLGDAFALVGNLGESNQ